MAPGGHWGLATETRHSCWLDTSHWRRILEQQGKPCRVPGVSVTAHPAWPGTKGSPWLHPLLSFPLALPCLETDSGRAVSRIRQDTADARQESHWKKALGDD